MNKVWLVYLLLSAYIFTSAHQKEIEDVNPYRFENMDDVIQCGKYRLRIKFGKKDGSARFKLFEKTVAGKWQKLHSVKAIRETDIPEIDDSEDLNNDGFRDIKIKYANAGRGANELDKLFIFDPMQKKLIDIVNSQEYPNLQYNETRNCINAFVFSGGSTTYFLNLKGKKLEEFGRVDYYNDTVRSYRIGKNDTILIKQIPYDGEEDGAVFFDDFDPIK